MSNPTQSRYRYPLLYSFRRCPYAMRARLAIAASGIVIELREIVLNNKPKSLLALSNKGTVPVLRLQDGRVLDQSIDIVQWALAKNDPRGMLRAERQGEIDALIQCNDEVFKPKLDRYKYADRFPEKTRTHYRQQCEFFLVQLDNRLSKHDYLMGTTISVADLAIFPFIRQFAGVDAGWFDVAGYSALNQWLKEQLKSPLFVQIMRKYTPWVAARQPLLLKGIPDFIVRQSVYPFGHW